jgi:hypothetical protein
MHPCAQLGFWYLVEGKKRRAWRRGGRRGEGREIMWK